MERNDFIQIIKLRSVWKVNRMKCNYELPNGKKLSDYVLSLVQSQMQIDSLGIMKNGNLCFCTGGNWDDSQKKISDFSLMPDFHENEICSFDEMEKRISQLVYEIISY